MPLKVPLDSALYVVTRSNKKKNKIKKKEKISTLSALLIAKKKIDKLIKFSPQNDSSSQVRCARQHGGTTWYYYFSLNVLIVKPGKYSMVEPFCVKTALFLRFVIFLN